MAIIPFKDTEQNCGESKQVFEAHERERELAERFGLSLAFQPFGAKRPAEPIIE